MFNIPTVLGNTFGFFFLFMKERTFTNGLHQDQDYTVFLNHRGLFESVKTEV